MIPDYQAAMSPILAVLADRQPHSLKELVDKVSEHFHLTEDERSELLESGTQTVITSRVGWARTYLTKAGLIEPVRKGVFVITDAGASVVKSPNGSVDVKFLKRFPAFQQWITASNSGRKNAEQGILKVSEEEKEEAVVKQTPQESIDEAFRKLKDELAFEVLDTLKKVRASSFENIVVDLLLKMGYGGSRKEAGRTIGKSGDGGIDGVIDEDKLGLDVIYIQAKRYQNPVAISEVRDFAGALLAKRTNKGIFISTSAFPQSAYDFVKSTGQRIVLIDGKQLAELMIENNVGVSVRSVYELKRVDSDYFEEI